VRKGFKVEVDFSGMKKKVVTARAARRALLAAQGLLDDPGRAATPRSIFEMIQRLGFVQMDSINVVERAHHLTLACRFDGYRPSMLDALLASEKRRLFEHWTHDASAIPLDWFEHWHHRFRRFRERLSNNAWFNQRIGKDPDRVLESVRARIRREGAMMSKDFESSGSEKKRAQGWWDWKVEKAALEYLWWTGELGVLKRVGFQKVYDLIERVYPEHVKRPASEPDQHVAWACRTALERLCFATPREIAQFWQAVPLPETRAWCAAAEKRGEIERVLVEPEDGSAREAFAMADRTGHIREIGTGRMRLLCPFDPVVRDRNRVLRLFAFDYRFEAFVPKPKRKFGYYVMPVLEGDRFVARVDPKLHREGGVLEIKMVHWEPGVRATKARRRALEEAIDRLGVMVGATKSTMPAREAGRRS
jgi:uncharacterized protein YcaQ